MPAQPAVREVTEMEGKQISAWVDGCLMDYQPPCAAVCPLGLDIRDWLKKIQRGNLRSAYRQYRDQAVFPAIAARICRAPCRESCLLGTELAIDLPWLEQACVEQGAVAPTAYHLPAKAQQVIVVGAGLSGLTCALRLAAQKYQVTVYEAKEEIGGSLAGQLPRELYLEEFRRQFAGEQYRLVTGTPLHSLAGLAFDAAYIATGQGGLDFADEPEQEKIFRGGSLLGAEGTERIRDGLRAAADIKAYLNLCFRDHPQRQEQPILQYPPPAGAGPARRRSGLADGREAAQQEAGRCRMCSCHACQERCDLLSYYQKTPRRVADDVYATLHQVPSYTNRLATRFSNACNQCGACHDACPQNIDIGKLLLATRQEMQASGDLPPAFHDFWLREMAFATQEADLLLLPREGCSSLFFPGCYLGAASPDYVQQVYRWLDSVLLGCGLLLYCCGAPALWAGDQALFAANQENIREFWQACGCPELIFACPNCEKIFHTYLPELPGRSLYPLLADNWPVQENTGHKLYVYDPCAARQSSALKDSVRRLALRCGAVPLNDSQEDGGSSCCGWGGHIAIADPLLHTKIVEERTQRHEADYLTYCINCRDTFVNAGKAALHVLDLAFGVRDARQPPPTVQQRRENRLLLK